MTAAPSEVDAPLIAYTPLTGPVPEDMFRGKTFQHRDVVITPELADDFLSVNAPNQRPISWINIERIVAEILNDEWDNPHPEGMVFDDTGCLIDGQHRCTALLEAVKVNPHKRLIMNVEHNWPREVWDKLNQGKKRTAADVMPKDMKNKGHIAAAATLYHKYMAKYHTPPITHLQWRKNLTSAAAIRAWVLEHPDIIKSFDLATPLFSKAYLNRSAGTVGIYLLRDHAQTHPLGLRVVHEFVNGIADPVAARCAVLDPRNTLNKVLLRRRVNDTPYHQSEPLGLFLRAWEKWCIGEETSDFQWNHKKSTMPDVFVPTDWDEVLRKWGVKL